MPLNPADTIARTILAEMERQGLSGDALGKRAGVHSAMVYRLARGTRVNITTTTASKLCAALGLVLTDTGNRAVFRNGFEQGFAAATRLFDEHVRSQSTTHPQP